MLIKSIKFTLLQAIERILHYKEWISILFVIAFILLGILKLIKPNKLFGFAIAFFTPGFFHKQAEENVSFFSGFQLGIFSFMCLVISIFCFTILPSFVLEKSIYNFTLLFALVTLYFLIRYFLDILISNALNLSEYLRYFIYAKTGYLKTLSIWLLPLLILNEFTIRSTLFIFISFSILLSFRFLLILYNNKRLVLNKLFYFILYLCTLEIAPLLILYKTTTK